MEILGTCRTEASASRPRRESCGPGGLPIFIQSKETSGWGWTDPRKPLNGSPNRTMEYTAVYNHRGK